MANHEGKHQKNNGPASIIHGLSQKDQDKDEIIDFEQSELSGISYGVLFLTGIAFWILYKIASLFALPNVLLDVRYWLGVWCISSLVLAIALTGYTQKSASRRLKAQTKERQVFARQLGFDYQSPEYSDNLHSSGLISGVYDQRITTIDSGIADLTEPHVRIWFTQIESELRSTDTVSVALWFRNEHLKKTISEKSFKATAFDYPDEDKSLAIWLLKQPEIKTLIITCGAYHIVANEGKLLVKFLEDRPSLNQLQSYLDLVIKIAMNLESAPSSLP